MLCTYCKKQINEGERFCPWCGEKVTSTNVIDKNESLRAASVGVNDIWKSETGTAMSFSFFGQVLEVPASTDVFNTYRLKFRNLASYYADCAKNEFYKKVHDLNTYMLVFPKIYSHYLTLVTRKAVDILIDEGIWAVTHESFYNLHLDKWHLVQDDMAITMESIYMTIAKVQQTKKNRQNLIFSLLDGDLDGAFSSLERLDSRPSKMELNYPLEVAITKLNPSQQRELYQRVNLHILFEHVFLDYWRVFLSLTDTLRNNGKNIVLISDDLAQQAENVFQNINGLNFPKDRIHDGFLAILKMMPYQKRYHQFMISHFGETAETVAIKDYFGYTDFGDPRIL